MNLRQLNHLTRHTEKVELYQELIRIRDQLEPEYRRILLTLTPADRQCIEYYVSFTQAVQERIARTAYFMTPTR